MQAIAKQLVFFAEISLFFSPFIGTVFILFDGNMFAFALSFFLSFGSQ